MTRFYAIMLLLMISGKSFGLDLKVMTYNIRYDDPKDERNAWSGRKENVVRLLRNCAPDIFGLQEALLGQINDIASRMPGYDWVGVGREDGISTGEYVPIFYNSQKYQLKEHGTFWLSETSHIPSRGWDAAFPRICTYALLEDYDTRQNFWVFNTHFDHLGENAREESVRLILHKIQDLNTKRLPVMLIGDFNEKPEGHPVKIMKRRFNDSYEVTETAPSGPLGTFNGFDMENPPGDRIDYIFTNRFVRVRKYTVVGDSFDNRYPSDHLPVMIEVIL